MLTTHNLNNDLLAKASASSCPLPLPVHHGQGGLTVAVGDGRRNRELLDAADGLSRP